MSTPQTEIKTAVATEKASIESRISALEAKTKSWYEKHLPLLAGIAGLAVGLLAGHFVRL